MASTNEQDTGVRIPPPPCWRSPSNYFVGVDLGQANDPTAVCVIDAWSQREEPTKPEEYLYTVVHLMRFPLGMSYPAMVRDIGSMLTRPPFPGSPVELIVDETGVGRAVGDIFNQVGLKPIKVTITAGNEEGQSGFGRYTVPKQVLVSNLDALMHTEQLFFSNKLRESPALEQELKDFRRHISEAGRYSFAARESQHDDLILATAIALWSAVKRKKYFGDDGSPPKVHHGYAHSKPHLHRRRS